MTLRPDIAAEHIWIEIDPLAKPIAGAVHHGPASVRPFAGWLELVALVEAACEATDDRANAS